MSESATKFIRRLFCTHNFLFVRNIYGDEIIACGYKRSLWRCTECDKEVFREKLQPGLRGDL